MIRNIASLLLLSTLFACGAPDEYLDAAGIDDETELGTLEAGFSAASTPTFQYGTRVGPTTNLRADKTSSAQVIAVFNRKNPTYCVETGLVAALSPAEHNTIVTMLSSFDASFTGWTATDYPDFGLGCAAAGGTPPYQVRFQKGSVGSSGTASNLIEDYARLTFGGLTNLTEGAGVVGQYQSASSCTITIDTTDLYAKGANATQDSNLFGHAVMHNWYGCLGLGARSHQSTFATRRAVLPASTGTGLTVGEVCSLTTYDTSASTNFFIAGSASTCPND